MRNQAPLHEPAFVAAPVADNDGNRLKDLFGSDAISRHKGRQIAVQIPADPLSFS